MRGDPPPIHRAGPDKPRSTPHARGSTPVFYKGKKCGVVYPACAGIHPSSRKFRK